MARRRTMKTVGFTFIDDAAIIHDLIIKHMKTLRVDSEHYEALYDLNTQFMRVVRQLHPGELPWSRSSTGPVRETRD